MKKILLSFVLCSIFVVYWALNEKNELIKEIMPSKLMKSSLPDNYDKSIELFFSDYYDYLHVQNPALSLNENKKAIDDYINSQSVDYYQGFLISYWILMNKYPDYYSEYGFLNTITVKTSWYSDEVFDKNYTAKYAQYKNKTIYSFASFIRQHLFYIHTSLNQNTWMFRFLWITGKVESIEERIHPNSGLKNYIVKINVSGSLGKDLFRQGELKLSIIYDDQSPDREVPLIDKLELNKTYLFPTSIITILPSEDDDITLQNFKTSYIPQVDFNSITKVIDNHIVVDKFEYLDYSKGYIVPGNKMIYLLMKRNNSSLDEMEENFSENLILKDKEKK